jgi:hypothetical protein
MGTGGLASRLGLRAEGWRLLFVETVGEEAFGQQ